MLTRRCLLSGTGTILAARMMTGPATAGAMPANMTDELLRIEQGSGGRLGVSVLDTGTGRRYAHRGGERFPMCSTAKALACGAVLARVDAGYDDLGRRIRFEARDLAEYSPVTRERVGGAGMTLAEICQAAFTRSDNTAANLILASLGGPSAVTAYARSLGDEVTRLDRTEPSLNDADPGRRPRHHNPGCDGGRPAQARARRRFVSGLP